MAMVFRLSLPKSRFERTDDGARQGSDAQQRVRNARSGLCRARCHFRKLRPLDSRSAANQSPDQDRIGDDHPADKGREQPDDRARVAGRLDDDLVIELQLSGELQQTIAFEIALPGISEFPIFQNGRLGE